MSCGSSGLAPLSASVLTGVGHELGAGRPGGRSAATLAPCALTLAPPLAETLSHGRPSETRNASQARLPQLDPTSGTRRNAEEEARTEPRWRKGAKGATRSSSRPQALPPLSHSLRPPHSPGHSVSKVPENDRGGTCLHRRLSPKPRAQMELTPAAARDACKSAKRDPALSPGPPRPTVPAGQREVTQVTLPDPNTPLPPNTTAGKQSS